MASLETTRLLRISAGMAWSALGLCILGQEILRQGLGGGLATSLLPLSLVLLLAVGLRFQAGRILRRLGIRYTTNPAEVIGSRGWAAKSGVLLTDLSLFVTAAVFLLQLVSGGLSNHTGGTM